MKKHLNFNRLLSLFISMSIVISTASLFTSLSRVSAQTEDIGAVSGSVLGGGAEAALIQLIDPETEEVYYETASSEGTYSFDSVDSGEYIIRAVKENCSSQGAALTVSSSPVEHDIFVSLLGDLDESGEIDLVDLLDMRKYLLGIFNESDVDLTAAKVAGGESVSLRDLLELRKYILGLTTVFPAYREVHVHDYELFELVTEENYAVDCAGKLKCSGCTKVIERSVDNEDIGLPVVRFNGSIEGVSKDNKVKIAVDYLDGEKDFFCYATLKVQGATSAEYPKKNYTIQFFEDEACKDKKKVELFEGCGKESKYCMKANWVDVTHSRNVVSAKLYNDVVKSRNADDRLSTLTNGGAIDGYPVVVFLNGDFLGLYTMNIPKDKWMFGMDGDESTKEGLLMADVWTNSVKLRESVEYDLSNGWDLEHCSTGDEDYAWMVDSFNEMIAFINENEGKAFKDGISEYVDVERAIDNFIFTIAISGSDNISKNILWATYDGTKWIPCMYDMDSTWGLFWDGSRPTGAADVTFGLGTVIHSNELWYALYLEYTDEICARYEELRGGILSDENVEKAFSDFIGSIPDFVYDAELERWQDLPGVSFNSCEQIIDFYEAHIAILDEQIEELSSAD